MTASAQGPAIGVVGEDGAIGAKLVDERCRAGGAGQLCPAEASSGGCPRGAGQQDGEGGQVRQDLVLELLRVFRTGNSGLIYAAIFIPVSSSITSRGVLYPSVE